MSTNTTHAHQTGTPFAADTRSEHSFTPHLLWTQREDATLTWHNPAPPHTTPACPQCASLDSQWRGYRNTKTHTQHRSRCNACGRWTQTTIQR